MGISHLSNQPGPPLICEKSQAQVFATQLHAAVLVKPSIALGSRNQKREYLHGKKPCVASDMLLCNGCAGAHTHPPGSRPSRRLTRTLSPPRCKSLESAAQVPTSVEVNSAAPDLYTG